MTYTTQPGTLQHRALAVLRALPPGSRLSTIELAEAVDNTPDAVAEAMTPAVKAGAIACHGRFASRFWSLGDGVPLPLPADYEPDKPIMSREKMAKKRPLTRNGVAISLSDD